MTVKQVKKHKEVIKWFCDNNEKGVYFRHKTWIKWQLTDEPQFLIDGFYVQNDEYAEFRKKICDLEQELNILKGQVPYHKHV